MAVSQDQLLTVINEASELRDRIDRLNEINDGLREERDDLKEEVSRFNTKVISLEIKNRQLHRWVMNLVKSRQRVKAAYSHDMRTLRAIEERYMASYAEHIRNTPLPE
jgi:predicted nuclease with TOPRIM domain